MLVSPFLYPQQVTRNGSFKKKGLKREWGWCLTHLSKVSGHLYRKANLTSRLEDKPRSISV